MGLGAITERVRSAAASVAAARRWLLESRGSQQGSRSTLVLFLAVVGLVLAAPPLVRAGDRDLAETALTAAIGLALAMLMARPSEAAAHACVLAYVTSRQLHAMPPPTARAGRGAGAGGARNLILEVPVCIVLVLMMGIEHTVVAVLRRRMVPETVADLCASQRFRGVYSGAAAVVLLLGALLPLPGCGLFYLDARQRAALAVLWAAVAATEARKAGVARLRADVDLPPVACKCAPMLYLHPYYWFIVALFVLAGIFGGGTGGGTSRPPPPPSPAVSGGAAGEGGGGGGDGGEGGYRRSEKAAREGSDDDGNDGDADDDDVDADNKDDDNDDDDDD